MSSPRTRRALLLLLPVLTVYLPVLGGVFNFDDYATILRNPGHGDWGVALAGFPSPAARPLFYGSLALDHWLWGLRPEGYHLTNLLLHLLNVALLSSLVRRLGGSPRAALLAGLLFGLHPLGSSAACYISQRGALMTGTSLLAFLNLLCLLPARPLLAGTGAALAYALGLWGKPSAVVVPLCALGFLPLLPGKEKARAWLASGALLAVCIGIWGMQEVLKTAYNRATWDLYALTQLRVVWRYLGLWLFPSHQSVNPWIQGSEGWLSPPSTLLGGLGLLLLLGLCLRLGNPWVKAGTICALMALLPESSVVGLPDRMFEYRMYVPLIALTLALTPLLERMKGKAACALLVLLGLLTAARALSWSSEERLWTQALRLAPGNLRCHANLVRIRRDTRRDEGARALIRRALRIQDLPELHGELALLALSRLETTAGLEHLDRAETLAPGRADLLPLRGRLLLASGRYAEAAEALARAYAKFPEDTDLPRELATALVLSGRPEEARPLLGKSGLLVLGTLLAREGRLEPAERILLRFTAQEPGNPLGWANLAEVFGRRGKPEKAREARERALGACGEDPAFSELRRELEETLRRSSGSSPEGGSPPE